MAASVPMKLFAEFLGTFLLMASIMASGGNFLIIGATLALIVVLIGNISGAAVNPAVSVGFWYSGILSGQLFFLYSLVQLLGGVAAVYAYKIVA
jgi:glycerol uptake facilitator-like aquaporin